MKRPIEFDETHWPILLVKHPEEPVDKELTELYLAELERYFKRQEKFVGIFIVNGSKPPTAEHRFLVASWIKRHRQLITSNFLGTAFVMPGLVQQLTLMTFLKFLETRSIIGPVKVFRHLDKAMKWAALRLNAGNNFIEEGKK